uniref:DUF3426 domain-containing protein n=1 Tax=Candidatus Kentrum sp. LPFa TaxID=2126335 RepID=A0A450WUT0_9GAMM|nr:MAG: Protein of unknown function (DUF3426) [Candidatus Kentron sp. LPFa]VFK28967.1 MAG: Protein of unknown function (DUF3426) [Candidatus Kentron sp. LPFa]
MVKSVTSISDDKGSGNEESVPQVLHENIMRAATKPPARKWRQFAFGFGVLLSCVVLLTQYTWFHSVDVLQRFPDLRPIMEIFCQSGCRIPVLRDPARIRIVDRNVRAHPKYKKALLVSARMVNTLPHTQPFPHMQLMLFNVNGQPIAARIFEPEEYLDSDIDLVAGMRADRPIQVVLGILAREEAAVNFEFTFL